MSDRVDLSGRFTKVRVVHLKKRASNPLDPRFIFYQGMLDYDTYEAYLTAVGGKRVYPPTFGNGAVPISGRAEILFVRRMGWIVDAAR